MGQEPATSVELWQRIPAWCASNLTMFAKASQSQGRIYAYMDIFQTSENFSSPQKLHRHSQVRTSPHLKPDKFPTAADDTDIILH